VARVVLSKAANATTQWQTSLPRFAGAVASRPAPGLGARVSRARAGDYERSDCDSRGAGRRLRARARRYHRVRYENATDYALHALNGAFTVWIRRPLETDNAGSTPYDDDNSRLVIVSEGVAPYRGGTDAFVRSHQAMRVLETRFALGVATAGRAGAARARGRARGGSAMGETSTLRERDRGAGGTASPRVRRRLERRPPDRQSGCAVGG